MMNKLTTCHFCLLALYLILEKEVLTPFASYERHSYPMAAHESVVETLANFSIRQTLAIAIEEGLGDPTGRRMQRDQDQQPLGGYGGPTRHTLLPERQ